MNIFSYGKTLFLIAALFHSAIGKQAAAGETIIIHEDFSSRAEWKDLHFPKISRHTLYLIERQGPDHYLRIESNASASAIVQNRTFNVYLYPRVRWRWKISNVYKKGTIMSREGDDYPVRIYVMFTYDPEKAGAMDRIRYGIAKRIYGTYPPHSTLSYVWANKKDEGGRVAASPYSNQAKMILLKKGMENAGTWQVEEVNILEDYRAAFGTAPPQEARMAIMNDSDNTKESSVSYVDYIDVFRTESLP